VMPGVCNSRFQENWNQVLAARGKCTGPGLRGEQPSWASWRVVAQVQ
jgi:hypothetical protein